MEHDDSFLSLFPPLSPFVLSFVVFSTRVLRQSCRQAVQMWCYPIALGSCCCSAIENKYMLVRSPAKTARAQHTDSIQTCANGYLSSRLTLPDVSETAYIELSTALPAPVWWRRLHPQKQRNAMLECNAKNKIEPGRPGVRFLT
jgi:hypothetical protein